MINKITGRLTALSQTCASVACGPFEYEVQISEYSRLKLQNELNKEITLYTIDYIDGNPTSGGRLIPRLVGFKAEAERDFYELLCSVDGLGTKKALRAMVRPVAEIASAIEEQNVKFLSGLPGLGGATAERIIAKLRRKVPKFALLVDHTVPGQGKEQSVDCVTEAFNMLVGLGHSETDARRKIDEVLKNSKKKFKDFNELIVAVYDYDKKSKK
ncbi:MAG: Holliday junction DNA helicase RuvA [Thermoguttaceae bacterium]|nr:Holliday junction DNA helicase RuvA [Thermoguttaceae bacterium]MBQ6619379.1 Holliday junction DNA helicase RuvA [Thermoguttaceae bacterium]